MVFGPNDRSSPEQRRLRIVSFVVHATRGVVRDRRTRRKTMIIAVMAGAAMVFAGSTFLAPLLDPHQHPGWFVFYWLVCVWITLTAVLLAVFDLLIIGVEGRAAKHRLREDLSKRDDD